MQAIVRSLARSSGLRGITSLRTMRTLGYGRSDPFSHLDILSSGSSSLQFMPDPFEMMEPIAPRRMQFHLDVTETKDAYELSGDVPGIPRADIHIDSSMHMLYISAERKSSHVSDPEKTETGEPDTTRYRRTERFYGKVQRSLALPQDADEENISAKLKDGILKVTIPKLANVGMDLPGKKTISIA